MSKVTSTLPPVGDIKEQLYELYTELVQAKENKRDLVKAHSENIKRIEAEIKDLLDSEEDDSNNAHNAVD